VAASEISTALDQAVAVPQSGMERLGMEGALKL
jgi:hypothetical protein